jgi:hypothetical protein
MSTLSPVAPGVMLSERREEATFECGSLRDLALGIRDVLWDRLDLFEEADEIVLYVGGDQTESEEDPVELEVSGSRVRLHSEICDELEAVREANLPSSDCARWPCDCDVYCDESHGEGRLEFHIARPSFHELAAWRSSRSEETSGSKSDKDPRPWENDALATSSTAAEIRLRKGTIVRVGDTVRARGEDNRLRTCRIIDIFPECGGAQALLTGPWPFGTVIRDASKVYAPRRRKP